MNINQPIQKFPFKNLGNNNAGDVITTLGDFRPFPYKSNASSSASGSAVEVLEREMPKEITYSYNDLLENKQKSFEEGYAKGYNGAKSAEAEIEKIIQSSLSDIALKLAAISEAIKTRNNAHIKELTQLVIRVARKVAGTALKQEPYTEIENVIRTSLPLLFDEPKLSIFVHPDLVKNIEGKITTLAKREGFKNNIEISSNSTLSLGSCDIEWNGGGIKSNKDAIWDQIEKLCECL